VDSTIQEQCNNTFSNLDCVALSDRMTAE
jgi:hypothetical protein